ncbi:MAG: LysR family transcriptional regulator [Proteobacteria bacterium]|jgi:DNA-binding transcriptional LysR family regulator|nr:LysR family transcriptional regulator [Pseudomonadota bacterium]
MKGPRVSLEQWRVLQAVVDCGGYAQAAEYLHRSQSSVSYTVARLQEQLGIRLLQIEGRKAGLTEAGEALLRRSRHLLDAALDLEQFADSLEEGREAEIRLVVDTAFPTDLLMAALRQFAPYSQGTRVQLTEVVLSGAEDALAQGRADLAIAAHVPVNYLGDPLIELELQAVAHADHPLQHLERDVTMADLERELQVIIRDSGMLHKRDMGWLGAEYRWSVSSMETATTAVSQGLGYAWLPRHQIKDLLDSGLLKPLPLREGGIYKGVLYLIYGRAGEAGPATRQLAKLLHAVCAETDH